MRVVLALAALAFTAATTSGVAAWRVLDPHRPGMAAAALAAAGAWDSTSSLTRPDLQRLVAARDVHTARAVLRHSGPALTTRQLSSRIARAHEQAVRVSHRALLLALACWSAALLLARRRLRVARHMLRTVLATSSLTLAVALLERGSAFTGALGWPAASAAGGIVVAAGGALVLLSVAAPVSGRGSIPPALRR